MIIAIDGPAGAGKSTVAQRLARRLGLRYLDTGAMYRALTLRALREHIDLDDEERLASVAADMEVGMEHVSRRRPPYRVFMDGEDITSAIRSREVSAHVSQVSSHPLVRSEMVNKQRRMAAGGGVVVAGDEDDRADAHEVDQCRLEQANRVDRRDGSVVDVAADEDGIH